MENLLAVWKSKMGARESWITRRNTVDCTIDSNMTYQSSHSSQSHMCFGRIIVSELIRWKQMLNFYANICLQTFLGEYSHDRSSRFVANYFTFIKPFMIWLQQIQTQRQAKFVNVCLNTSPCNCSKKELKRRKGTIFNFCFPVIYVDIYISSLSTLIAEAEG